MQWREVVKLITKIQFSKMYHQYQKIVIKHLIKTPFSGVFLDMGMGKTASVLYTLKHLKKKGLIKRALILSPLFVASYTWKDEIEKWQDFEDLKISIAVGKDNKRRDAFAEDSDIVIMNYENTVWMVKNISMKNFDVLIVDELSNFKNPDAQRFKALSRIIHRFKYRWGLTGTPSPNTYLDLFSQIYLIDPNILGSNFYAFRSKYFYEKNMYTWDLKKGKEKELLDQLKTNCISLRAEDYLKLPQRIDNHIKLTLNRTEYMTYLKALERQVYSSQNEIDLSSNLIIKLQQLASGFIYLGNGEYEIVHTLLIDKVGEIIDCCTGNTLLFFNFQAEKEQIIKKFGAAAVELKNNKDFENWNNGKIKLAVCHPITVGYGMNLQSGGNNIIWYGYNWAADTTQQANARLYRQGQKNGVIINYLYTGNTIHERIRKVLDGKIQKQDLLRESINYVQEKLNCLTR